MILPPLVSIIISPAKFCILPVTSGPLPVAGFVTTKFCGFADPPNVIFVETLSEPAVKPPTLMLPVATIFVVPPNETPPFTLITPAEIFRFDALVIDPAVRLLTSSICSDPVALIPPNVALFIFVPPV